MFSSTVTIHGHIVGTNIGVCGSGKTSEQSWGLGSFHLQTLGSITIMIRHTGNHADIWWMYRVACIIGNWGPGCKLLKLMVGRAALWRDDICAACLIIVHHSEEHSNLVINAWYTLPLITHGSLAWKTLCVNVECVHTCVCAVWVF